MWPALVVEVGCESIEYGFEGDSLAFVGCGSVVKATLRLSRGGESDERRGGMLGRDVILDGSDSLPFLEMDGIVVALGRVGMRLSKLRLGTERQVFVLTGTRLFCSHEVTVGEPLQDCLGKIACVGPSCRYKPYRLVSARGYNSMPESRRNKDTSPSSGMLSKEVLVPKVVRGEEAMVVIGTMDGDNRNLTIRRKGQCDM